jgi:hypothetical protein
MESETKEPRTETRSRSLTSSEASLRRIASWVAIMGTCLLAAYFFSFMIYHSCQKTSSEGSWFLQILEKHFAAALGVPLSAISSTCVILLLKATTGPIEFEGMGFKFRGASGPIILWILCFLAIILGVYLLWNK